MNTLSSKTVFDQSGVVYKSCGSYFIIFLKAIDVDKRYVLKIQKPRQRDKIMLVQVCKTNLIATLKQSPQYCIITMACILEN